MADISINNRLWGFKGAIGRREYILNTAYICIISMAILMPYFYWIFQNLGEFYKISNVIDILKIAPMYVKLSIFAAWLGIIPPTFGLVLRRINDITNRDNCLQNSLIVILLLIFTYWAGFTGIGIIWLLSVIVSILLFCIKGKVTGALPKDEVKRFNWGAFWGTWIWGLINKSYKTLWAIPAFILFPIFPYVQIICGIKGNEWAYEKAKNKELTVFHRGQKHQATFWNIFSGVGIFLLPFLTIMIMAAAAIGYAAANPEKMEQAAQEYHARVENQVSENFDKYELGNDENKFYMNPQKWVEMDYNQKYAFFNLAGSFASIKKSELKDENYTVRQSREEKAITKIYSTYNNEILAEFDLSQIDMTDFKTIVETSKNAFKMNENPKLP